MFPAVTPSNLAEVLLPIPTAAKQREHASHRLTLNSCWQSFLQKRFAPSDLPAKTVPQFWQVERCFQLLFLPSILVDALPILVDAPSAVWLGYVPFLPKLIDATTDDAPGPSFVLLTLAQFVACWLKISSGIRSARLCHGAQFDTLLNANQVHL